MDKFSYFHLCDHRIKKVPRVGEQMTIEVVTGSDANLIDTVINGGILLKVHEIRAIEFDPKDVEIVDFFYDNPNSQQTYDELDQGEAYYDDKDEFVVDYSRYFREGETISEVLPAKFYEPILHNRIRWLVKPPKKYQVVADVKFTHESYQTYTSLECPICNGRGWFVDILDKNGSFVQPTGILKIAQRVVKDLLTELESQMFDAGYGQTLKRELMLSSSDDERIFDVVRLSVSNVEDGYLTDQQNIITELSNEEILQALVTEEVYRHPQQPTRIIVRIRIRTVTEEQIFQLGL